jgi:hypothetical protein
MRCSRSGGFPLIVLRSSSPSATWLPRRSEFIVCSAKGCRFHKASLFTGSTVQNE